MMRASRATFVALIVMTFVLIALTATLIGLAFSRVAFACGLCALWIAKGGKA